MNWQNPGTNTLYLQNCWLKTSLQEQRLSTVKVGIFAWLCVYNMVLLLTAEQNRNLNSVQRIKMSLEKNTRLGTGNLKLYKKRMLLSRIWIFKWYPCDCQPVSLFPANWKIFQGFSTRRECFASASEALCNFSSIEGSNFCLPEFFPRLGSSASLTYAKRLVTFLT